MDEPNRKYEMLTNTKIALAAAVILGVCIIIAVAMLG